MFKKKRNIPARPKPPITEQIVEDLRNTNEFDVIFTTPGMKKCDNPSRIDYQPILTSDSDEIFSKVRNFVEINHKLQVGIHELYKKNELLQSSDLELKLITDDIKRQALEALK